MLPVKSLATPIVWVAGLLILGLVVLRRTPGKNRLRAGWWLVFIGTLVLAGLSLPTVAHLLSYSLEYRYPSASPDVLAELDVVVVLGAGARPAWGFRTEAELGGKSYSRWYHGLRAFKSSGADFLVFCGGDPSRQGDNESEVMQAMAVHMGVPAEKMLVDSQSCNTHQHAPCLAALLPAGSGRRIGLVTSATHMLRAEKVFRRHFTNDTIVPVPADYRYGPLWCGLWTFIPSASALEESTTALHEWIGLAWYSLRYW